MSISSPRWLRGSDRSALAPRRRSRGGTRVEPTTLSFRGRLASRGLLRLDGGVKLRHSFWAGLAIAVAVAVGAACVGTEASSQAPNGPDGSAPEEGGTPGVDSGGGGPDASTCPTACTDGKVCKAGACTACADPADDALCGTGKLCVAGACHTQPPQCADGLICFETTDTCGPCTADDQCNDGLFCNGTERCVAGACVAGTTPCAADFSQVRNCAHSAISPTKA